MKQIKIMKETHFFTFFLFTLQFPECFHSNSNADLLNFGFCWSNSLHALFLELCRIKCGLILVQRFHLFLIWGLDWNGDIYHHSGKLL